MVYCWNCGTQNEDDANFCTSCGARLTPGKDTRTSSLEENMEQVAEELKDLGVKTGKTVERIIKDTFNETPASTPKDTSSSKDHVAKEPRPSRQYGPGSHRAYAHQSWYDYTFGWMGPLISSLLGFIVLVFIIKMLQYFGGEISGMIQLSTFLEQYLLFLLIFMLFTSYTSYIARRYPFFRWLSPLVSAIGFLIWFWVCIQILFILSTALDIALLGDIASIFQLLLIPIAILILLVGYVGLMFSTSQSASVQRAGSPVRPPPTRHEPPSSRTSYQRLYRSRKDKILGGVCGGLAAYFNIDPVLIRLVFIVGLLVSLGTMIIVYCILWFVIPQNPL
jgi:phage shock protein C